MQTLVYIIGGYCLIKAVFHEFVIVATVAKDPFVDMGKVLKAQGITAILFLAAVEAFNQ